MLTSLLNEAMPLYTPVIRLGRGPGDSEEERGLEHAPSLKTSRRCRM